MIFTMIGGGAHRLLATVRGAIAEGVFQNGGELRYYDLDASRAQVMAEMIQKSPEFRANPAPITVKWDLTLETALEGANVVSVTLLAGGSYVKDISEELAWSYGFIGSDNVSYPGAFLALRGAPILMNIARTMEKVCPKAILLNFANPVAVLSAMVSRHTSIHCYGVCEGYVNHGYDLTRLLTGEDRYDPNYDVLVAGVNHASFIVDGSLNGVPLQRLLNERLREEADPISKINFAPYLSEFTKDWIRFGLRTILTLYKERGVILFSTEPDGFSQYFHEDAIAYNGTPFEHNGVLLSDDAMNVLEKRYQQGCENRQEANRIFAEYAKKSADDIPWNDPAHHVFCVPKLGDVQGKILAGLSGAKETRVAVSAPNNGAVSNIPHGMAVEFSHTVTPKGLTPIQGLAVPDTVLGMTTALAVHQTLLADACFTHNPHDLHKALLAFPYASDTAAAKELWRKLLIVSRDTIHPDFQELVNVL